MDSTQKTIQQTKQIELLSGGFIQACSKKKHQNQSHGRKIN